MFTNIRRIFGRKFNDLNFRVLRHFFVDGFLLSLNENSLFSIEKRMSKYVCQNKSQRTQNQIFFFFQKIKKNMSQNQWLVVVCGVLYKYSAECAMKLKRFSSVTTGLLCLQFSYIVLNLNHTAFDYIRKYSNIDEANNEYVSYRPVFDYIEYSNVSLHP